MKGLVGGSPEGSSAATLQPLAGEGYCTASIELTKDSTYPTGKGGQ
ncbi:hypothetical protein [Arthrobacter sp. PAMC25564]|nr:hypothetical protein [Arthrobacter sp. PAMC25564]